ncbi:MAG: prepilin-type N-terminal cleavage/methylation domain-containing protein [Luteolibacter sp.]
MTPSPPPPRKHGFLLLEVVLALAVFSMAATGFVVALHRMAQAADLAQQELRLTRLLDSSLDEALSIPTMTIGVTSREDVDSGIELVTEIRELENLLNEDGQTLREMYAIRVTAHWFQNGDWQQRTVETWRYGRLYQP